MDQEDYLYYEAECFTFCSIDPVTIALQVTDTEETSRMPAAEEGGYHNMYGYHTD